MSTAFGMKLIMIILQNLNIDNTLVIKEHIYKVLEPNAYNL
jgi:hypothetical protein